jgi:peptide/nickel transport system substrate-binding protein
VPNVSVVPPAMPGHVAAYRPVRDLARARALLAEAGHAGGLDVTLEYSTNFWWEEGFALALRDQLAEAGIRVTPRRITATDFAARGAITRRDLPFFVRENAIFVLDAAYAMSLLATTRGVSNQNGYSNPRFDELVEQALKEADDTRFLALVDEAQRLHAADATWVNTVMPGVFAAMASCIEGWTWHPHNRPRWADLSCAR